MICAAGALLAPWRKLIGPRSGAIMCPLRTPGSPMKVPASQTIKQRILDRIATRPSENAFLRSEFNDLAKSRTGVDKALRALVQQGVLVRGGYGVLVRARSLVYQDKQYAYPSVESDVFVREILDKIGVPYRPTQVVRDYMAGKTTQLQANLVLNVGRRRIRRKIGWGQRTVRYEYDRGRAIQCAG